MAIKLEVGKQYITRDGTEYTAPLEQLTENFGDAEYNPEEIKMDEKVVVNIEVGKTYRTREGKEVTLEPWDSYTLKGSNGFLYNKSLTGSVYSCEHSEFDIVEEVMKEPVTTFTTQQEVFKHLASGGYISCSGVNIYGFTEEGILASFDIYGDFMYKVNFTFNAPSDWQVATIEPKPVPRWEDALKDKKVLCKVGYREDDLYLVAVIHDLLSDADYPYESVEGEVYTFAVPLTLEEVTNYIYECE